MTRKFYYEMDLDSNYFGRPMFVKFPRNFKIKIKIKMKMKKKEKDGVSREVWTAYLKRLFFFKKITKKERKKLKNKIIQ